MSAAPTTQVPAIPTTEAQRGGRGGRGRGAGRGGRGRRGGGNRNRRKQIPAGPTDTDEPSPQETTGPNTEPEVSHSASTSEPDVSGEKNLLKELSRRLKRATKKLESIAKSEEKIKHLTEQEKVTTTLINADERKKIAEKPIVQAVHKELEEVYSKLQEDLEAEERRLEDQLSRQKAVLEAQTEIDVLLARTEGLRQGEKDKTNANQPQLVALLRFLRMAGHRRVIKSGRPDEDMAIEELLITMYSGHNSALPACGRLANGTADIVSRNCPGITYGRIKELAFAYQSSPEATYSADHSIVQKAPETPQDSQQVEAREERPFAGARFSNKLPSPERQPVPRMMAHLAPAPGARMKGTVTVRQGPGNIPPVSLTDEPASNVSGHQTHFSQGNLTVSAGPVQPIVQEVSTAFVYTGDGGARQNEGSFHGHGGISGGDGRGNREGILSDWKDNNEQLPVQSAPDIAPGQPENSRGNLGNRGHGRGSRGGRGRGWRGQSRGYGPRGGRGYIPHF